MSVTTASVQGHQRADKEGISSQGHGRADDEDSSGEVLLCSQPGAVNPTPWPASQPAAKQGSARPARATPASVPAGCDAIRAAVARRLQASSQAAEVCEDCGRARPTFRDCTDNRKYCHDCWVGFYGEPPLSAAPVKPSLSAAPVKPPLLAAPVKPKRISVGDVQRSELPAVEVETGLLPEDAPGGHPAWAACRFNGHHKNPLVAFRWRGNGIDVPFQTTVFTAGGSRHAAEVIARACYMRFEQGWSKDQVLKFRQACYARIRQAGHVGVKQLQSFCPRPVQPTAPKQVHYHMQVQPAAPKQVHCPLQPRVQQAEPQRTRSAAAASNIAQRLFVREEPHCTAPHSQPASSSKRMPVVLRTAPIAQSSQGAGTNTGPGFVSANYLRNLLDDPAAPLPQVPWDVRAPPPGRSDRGRQHYIGAGGGDAMQSQCDRATQRHPAERAGERVPQGHPGFGAEESRHCSDQALQEPRDRPPQPAPSQVQCERSNRYSHIHAAAAHRPDAAQGYHLGKVQRDQPLPDPRLQPLRCQPPAAPPTLDIFTTAEEQAELAALARRQAELAATARARKRSTDPQCGGDVTPALRPRECGQSPAGPEQKRRRVRSPSPEPESQHRECSQPTPQLVHTTPQVEVTDNASIPTPVVDEPTPCLTLPTPQLGQQLPPFLRGIAGQIGQATEQWSYQPTPCMK
mmetsp:Transcript_55325/g.104027  ORF Transcript_55325/g.104027 Transcript_55325/m.104027 type:complete len:686 (+) Transcript_55325:26-2083(+)